MHHGYTAFRLTCLRYGNSPENCESAGTDRFLRAVIAWPKNEALAKAHNRRREPDMADRKILINRAPLANTVGSGACRTARI